VVREPCPFRVGQIGLEQGAVFQRHLLWNPRDPAAALSIPPGEGGRKGESGLSETRVLATTFPGESGDSTTLPTPLPDAPAFSARALGERVPEGLTLPFFHPYWSVIRMFGTILI